jgi:hypothetical protein
MSTHCDTKHKPKNKCCQQLLKLLKNKSPCSNRIEITTLPHTISESGNYCLAKNLVLPELSPGIKITANNVTLDLNSSNLELNQSTAVAIEISGVANVIVRNGSITSATQSDSSTNVGIKIINSSCVVISNVNISNVFTGIEIDTSSEVVIDESCLSRSTTTRSNSHGISSTNSTQLILIATNIHNYHQGVYLNTDIAVVINKLNISNDAFFNDDGLNAGIFSDGSTQVVIDDVVVHKFAEGIVFSNSFESSLRHASIALDYGDVALFNNAGIKLDASSDIKIDDVIIYDYGRGIDLSNGTEFHIHNANIKHEDPSIDPDFIGIAALNIGLLQISEVNIQNYGLGISLTTDSATANNIIVSKANISHVSQPDITNIFGVNISGVTGGQFSNSIITNYADGIHVDNNSDGITIRDITLQQNNTGIRLNNSSNSLIQATLIASGSNSGIVVGSGSKNLTFTDNTISNNKQNGILTEPNSSQINITNNTLIGNTNGIVLNGTKALVRQNDITFNTTGIVNSNPTGGNVIINNTVIE